MKIKKSYVLNPNRVHNNDVPTNSELLTEETEKTIAASSVKNLPVGKRNPLKRKATDLKTDRKLAKISQKNRSTSATSSTIAEVDTIQLTIEKILKRSARHDAKEFVSQWYGKFEKFVIEIKEKFYDENNWTKQCKKAGMTVTQRRFSIIKACIGNSPNGRGFQIMPAFDVQLIGSNRLGTNVGNQPIDICIIMPRAIFEQANLKNNNTYHELKTIYLAHLAVHLMQWKHVAFCQFEYFQNDPYQPVLVLTPLADGHPSGTVPKFVVHVVAQSNTCDLITARPLKDNWTKFIKSTRKPIVSRPISSIARDLAVLENDMFAADRISGQPNICQAIRLIKIWLQAHGVRRMLPGHVLTMFAVYLLQKNKLRLSMNVTEVVRGIWLNFANSNWHNRNQGITLFNDQTNLHEFHDTFDVVFIDSTGTVNLAADLFLDTYLYVKELCRKALTHLNRANVRFLFRTTTPVYLQFDHVFSIKKTGVTIQSYAQFVRLVCELLRKGLGERVVSIVPIVGESSTWNVFQCPPEWPSENSDANEQIAACQTATFGLVLHAQHALEVMTKGPAANDDEAAAAFKVLWGAKSELRRFQDGSVVEACLWQEPAASMQTKRLIVRDIVLHLLGLHLDVSANCVAYVADQFDSAFTLSEEKFNDVEAPITEDVEHLTPPIIRCFDEIARSIRALENTSSLPLDIATILGASAVFRYTDLRATEPLATEYVNDGKRIFQSYRVYDGVIQFGSNGNWPNDLAAIQRVKAALLLQMAKGLRDQFEMSVMVKCDCIEILRDGFVFRLKIALPKELLLLKHTVTSKGITKYRDNDNSRKLECELFLKPKLTTVLHTLHQRHHSFGPTVLIAKRWLHSQLIDSYLWPDECTELIVAYMFTNSGYGLDAPTQPQTGFFRFIKLLSEIDWRNTFLYISFDYDGEPESDDIRTKFNAEFAKNRNNFPSLCLATSIDESKLTSIWTKKAPTVEIIARVVTLARHSYELIDSRMTKTIVKCSPAINPAQFFCPSLSGYNAVIVVRKCHVHTCHLYDFKHNLKRKQLIDKSVPAAEFEPIEYYVRDLRYAYGDFAHFFYDPCGGNEIGVIWKPHVEAVGNFDARNMSGKCCGDTDGEYKCNYEQLLEDFRIIGNELVELIQK